MVDLDYKKHYYVFENTLDPETLMMSGREKKLRNVEYVESNKGKSGRSVWQGDPIYNSYNDDYEVNVRDLEDGEILMLEGRFLDPDRDDNYTDAEIKRFTNRYVVKKEGSDKCKVYELTYRESVELGQERYKNNTSFN